MEDQPPGALGATAQPGEQTDGHWAGTIRTGSGVPAAATAAWRRAPARRVVQTCSDTLIGLVPRDSSRGRTEGGASRWNAHADQSRITPSAHSVNCSGRSPGSRIQGFPNDRPTFPATGQWLGSIFPVTVAGAAALRGLTLSHSLFACRGQEPVRAQLRIIVLLVKQGDPRSAHASLTEHHCLTGAARAAHLRNSLCREKTRASVIFPELDAGLVVVRPERRPPRSNPAKTPSSPWRGFPRSVLHAAQAALIAPLI
ncbi:MAG: hypothetical protein JWR79_830 [Tardiphaga sp.]|nr:hypothetical protein [Tardiphaga sp.]